MGDVSRLLGRPGFELHTLDLATADTGPLLAGAAAVFHLAARPGVRTSFGPGFPGYLHDNVLATPAAARGLRPRRGPAAGGRLLLQRLRRRPQLPGHRGVEDATGLAYGVTKLAAEQLCQAYARLPGRRWRWRSCACSPCTAPGSGPTWGSGEALLGYRPETDLADGMAAQVAWATRRQRAAAG